MERPRAATSAPVPSTSAAHADVDRMWAERDARLKKQAQAAWPLKVVRRIRTSWFQYNITLAPYCFEWWESCIVHALVAGGIALLVYGGILLARVASLVVGRARRGA